MKSKESSLQWEPLMLTLYISRAVGAAPVSFRDVQDNGQGCPATVSRPINIYSCLLLLVLHAGILTGVILDFCTETEHSVRVRTPTATVAWITELLLLSLITTIGVFGASHRLKLSIQYLNIIDEINSKIECRTRKYACKKIYISAAAYIVVVLLLYAADFYVYTVEAIHHNKNTTVAYLYVCFYVESIVAALLTMQFTWIALFIESVLDSVNNALQDLIYMTELQTLPTNDLSTEYFDIDTTNFPIPVKPVNTLTDTLTPVNNDRAQQTVKGASDSLRRLVLSYVSVCDVIRGVQKCYGLILVLLIGSFLLHFVVTPFYFIGFWYSKKERTLSLCLQLLFITFHCISMLSVVEPGYLTEKQMEFTQKLVRQLSHRMSSPFDSLAAELDHFLKQIELNKIYYTPMNVCTVTRGLITKIMGAVTTYLVIILQFQQLDKNNW